MTEADFHRIATALPGATMEVLWGADRVYKVGGKMFAAMGPSGSFSFKASDIAFEMLTESGRARPAPYMARAQWVQFDNVDQLDEEELKSYLAAAHQLIAAKLSRKKQAELGL
ncbi:MAG TPA: MmcQ/YjbR family DNA-binding protein [Caulobacteraceae bacterium]|nr:MmcQ/YjbR family DNA-binding protein [Caulobacteraceae bacterium]